MISQAQHRGRYHYPQFSLLCKRKTNRWCIPPSYFAAKVHFTIEIQQNSSDQRGPPEIICSTLCSSQGQLWGSGLSHATVSHKAQCLFFSQSNTPAQTVRSPCIPRIWHLYCLIFIRLLLAHSLSSSMSLQLTISLWAFQLFPPLWCCLCGWWECPLLPLPGYWQNHYVGQISGYALAVLCFLLSSLQAEHKPLTTTAWSNHINWFLFIQITYKI